MFKLAKWAFDMGVRQERVRIAAHLQLELARHAHYPQQTFIRPYAGHSLTPEQVEQNKKHQLEFDAAVSYEVTQIIENIMQPEMAPGSSIMYPNDNHKG